MQNYPKVSAMLALYGDTNFIRDCLNSLENDYPNLEIIIKNQKSDVSAKSSEILKKEFPSVILIEGENNGLAAGFNDCIKKASGEYFLFLGSDTRPYKGTVEGLVNFLKSNPEVGAVTPELLLGDGSIDMDAHRAFPTPWISFTRLFGLQKLFPNSNLFNGYFLPDRDMTKPHEIDLCISHFMMVPRNVYEKVGSFDEAFFLYGEDVDYCYRIKQAGYKIFYLPQFKSIHLKGVSVGIRKTTRDMVKKPLDHRLKMQKLTTDSMQIFVKKHYYKKYPKLFVNFMLFGANLLGFIRINRERSK